MKYDLKQADEKQQFSTGAQRDSQKDKSRPDLISPVFLDRLGALLAKGAEHYGERNWEQGIPLSRSLASAMRHLVQTIDGQEDEDHAIQTACNLMFYVHTLHRIRAGLLPVELDDMPHEKNLTADLTSTKKVPTIECALARKLRPGERLVRCAECNRPYGISEEAASKHSCTCGFCGGELNYAKC